MLVIVDKRKELPQDGRTILADAVVLEFIVNPRPQVSQVRGRSQGLLERDENIIDVAGRGRGGYLSQRIGRGEFVAGEAMGGVGKRVQGRVLVELPGENVLAGQPGADLSKLRKFLAHAVRRPVRSGLATGCLLYTSPSPRD